MEMVKTQHDMLISGNADNLSQTRRILRPNWPTARLGLAREVLLGIKKIKASLFFWAMRVGPRPGSYWPVKRCLELRKSTLLSTFCIVRGPKHQTFYFETRLRGACVVDVQVLWQNLRD